MNLHNFMLLMIYCIASYNSIILSNDSLDGLIEEQLGKPVIYCPWREAYSNKKNEEDHELQELQMQNRCAFCAQISAHNDKKYFILRRFNNHVVMFNAFPVTKGHLLVVPYTHVPSLSDLSKEAREELMEIITFSIELLKEILHVEGVNFGANIGRRSGASIPDHVHIHIIPRRLYERSFHEIIGDVNVISWNMQDLYLKLKDAFNKVLLT